MQLFIFKRLTAFFCFIFINGIVCCQTRDTLDSKWINASIPIKVILRPTFQEEQVFVDLYENGRINFRQFDSLSKSIEVEGWGTAVYLKIDSVHYLLTAKHMLTRDWLKDTNHRVNSILVIPRTYDSIQDFDKVDVFERNGASAAQLSSGIKVTISGGQELPNLFVYTGGQHFALDFYRFSIPVASKNIHFYITPPGGEDLAIINIDEFGIVGKQFLKTLDRWGYRPIGIRDIYSRSTIKFGKRVFCVGFPQESIAKFTQLPTRIDKYVKSDLKGIPMVTKGVSEKVNLDSVYFHSSIFTYHGFSGGPILMDNKLIGLTSGSNLPTSVEGKNLIYISRFLSSKRILDAISRIRKKGI